MGAQPPPHWKSGGFDFQEGFSPQRGLSPTPLPVQERPISTVYVYCLMCVDLFIVYVI